MTAEVVVEEEFVRQERLWLPELESLSSISCRSVDLPLPSTDPFLSCWSGGHQKSCETPQCVGSVVSASWSVLTELLQAAFVI